MAAAFALAIISGIFICIYNSAKPADFAELLFHRRGRSGNLHLSRKIAAKNSSGFPYKYVYGSRFSVLTSTSTSGRAVRRAAATAAVTGNSVA